MPPKYAAGGPPTQRADEEAAAALPLGEGVSHSLPVLLDTDRVDIVSRAWRAEGELRPEGPQFVVRCLCAETAGTPAVLQHLLHDRVELLDERWHDLPAARQDDCLTRHIVLCDLFVRRRVGPDRVHRVADLQGVAHWLGLIDPLPDP